MTCRFLHRCVNAGFNATLSTTINGANEYTEFEGVAALASKLAGTGSLVTQHNGVLLVAQQESRVSEETIAAGTRAATTVAGAGTSSSTDDQSTLLISFLCVLGTITVCLVLAIVGLTMRKKQATGRARSVWSGAGAGPGAKRLSTTGSDGMGPGDGYIDLRGGGANANFSPVDGVVAEHAANLGPLADHRDVAAAWPQSARRSTHFHPQTSALSEHAAGATDARPSEHATPM